MKAEELELIEKIASRAVSLSLYDWSETPKMTAFMDLSNAIKHWETLRLQDLLDAETLDFAHDICGIQESIKRDVYPATFSGMFYPRFA